MKFTTETTRLFETTRGTDYPQAGSVRSEKEKLLKEVEYIKRNISGQNTLQAKGKLKRLSRIVQAVEQIGMDTALNQKWSETAEEVKVTTSNFGVEEAERRVRALRSPVRTLPHLHLRLGSEKTFG